MNAKHQQRIDNAIAAITKAPPGSESAIAMEGYARGVVDGLQAADGIDGDELLVANAAIAEAAKR